ncbi:MAG: fibronectin type III domain-containing protein [Treponema sp.]|nr:fibronectin type III domain-containing protein [Treponema sp.]
MNVITFTDGLDNTSVGKSMLTPIEDQTFSSEDEYTTYLSGQIASRTIAGKPITAYSVGVMGSGVTNTEKFTGDLKKIASTGKSQSLTDFGNLQTTFQDIADSLEITQTTSVAFTLKTTLLPNGAKVRMTFDTTGTSSSDASASSRYIEGTISATGSEASLSYTFNSITYSGGFGSEQGAGPIPGVIDGSEVKFAFTNVTGYNPAADESKAKQWLMSPGYTAWSQNEEYSITGATNTEIESRSSIIYLVLDSSTSLNTTQIGQIRDTASAFINSLFSQIVGFVTSGVSATAESSNSITVSWNRVSDADSYRVYRSTSSDGPYSRIGPTNTTISSTAYTDTSSSLTPNTTYYYKVSAYNANGEGAQSSYASAKTMAVGTPQGVSAEVVSSSSIRVRWYSVSGASGYKVYRSTSSNGSYEEVKDSPPISSVGSYTDTGLLSATTYYYKVSAYNANGEGARSSYVSATTSSP